MLQWRQVEAHHASTAARLSDSLLARQPTGGRATIVSCIINLSSTCMGTGILSLPFAFSNAGFAAGCALCVACAGTCGLTLYLLVESGARVGGRPTLGTVCQAALPQLGVVIDISVIFNCLGTATSYFIVAADCFSALGVPRNVCVLASMLVVTPPSFFRSMDTLKASSTVAISSLICIVLLVVAFGLGFAPQLDPCPGESHRLHGHCGGHIEPLAAPLSIFCTLPYFMMAYSCQACPLGLERTACQPISCYQREVVASIPNGRPTASTPSESCASRRARGRPLSLAACPSYPWSST